MEQPPTPPTPSNLEDEDPEAIGLVQWQDFEQQLARLFSLSSALRHAEHRKLSLQVKLRSLIQDEAESLNRLNKLEQMCRNLEARKMILDNLSTSTKLAVEDVKTQKESLSSKVRSLLVAGAALSLSTNILQDSRKLISGEKGYVRLAKLQRMLRTRQQHMISQVSLLYPVKLSVGPPRDQQHDSFPSTGRSDFFGFVFSLFFFLDFAWNAHWIFPRWMVPFKVMRFFANTKEVQSFAAALGYVAHAVSLVASYLKVPLRYPLRLCGSHSYINDIAPSIESTSSETPSTSLLDSTVKPVEFPLFLAGQDTTRAAYALLLLNKDLEQLLNFIGTKSLGPRHLLANLKELMRIIQSADFLGS